MIQTCGVATNPIVSHSSPRKASLDIHWCVLDLVISGANCHVGGGCGLWGGAPREEKDTVSLEKDAPLPGLKETEVLEKKEEPRVRRAWCAVYKAQFKLKIHDRTFLSTAEKRWRRITWHISAKLDYCLLQLNLFWTGFFTLWSLYVLPHAYVDFLPTSKTCNNLLKIIWPQKPQDEQCSAQIINSPSAATERETYTNYQFYYQIINFIIKDVKKKQQHCKESSWCHGKLI